MATSLGDALMMNGRVGRKTYFTTGITLFAFKFALDWSIARSYQRSWTPLNYLIWPDRSTLLVFQLPEADQQFGMVMLAIAIPFIWVGVTFTVQRLRDAGLPLPLIVLFFTPVINILFILCLCLIPSKPPTPDAFEKSVEVAPSRRFAPPEPMKSTPGAFMGACIISVAVGLAIVLFSTNLLRSYGFGLFVAGPFIQGFVAATTLGFFRPRSAVECVSVAVLATFIAGLCMLGFAIEGLICVIMAAPIAIPLAVLGGMVGYVVQARPWVNDSLPTMLLGLGIVMPALIAAESFSNANPNVRSVHTTVIVNAPPEVVWRHVVAFPALAEPTDWLFRTGIAYPQRAEIHGAGVSAIRHCVFSTGAFVEPIEIWDEPTRLAFRVTEQPPPMEELSPFHIHPPHLDNFLVSQRGEFHLERLADGRTKLTGTTWYTNRMWPADYWGFWSDYIIGRIHGRVLDHVRDLSEER